MMICKLKTINKIFSKLTVKALPMIEGEPNYEGINEIMQLLYSNAGILLKPEVRGHHGHTSIIMKPTLYTTLLTMVWANPPDLGVYPKISRNATAAHRVQLQLQHNEEHRIYKNTGIIYEALKNQFIYTVKYTYLKELNNKYTGFLRVIFFNILEHLIDRYSKIVTMDLKANNQ